MSASLPFTSCTTAHWPTLFAAPLRTSLGLACLWLAGTSASTTLAQDLKRFPALSLPASPVAYGRLEERACTSHTATGQAIITCHKGLADYSGGKSCIWAATYVDGTERTDLTREACVLACTKDSLVPDEEVRCQAIDLEYKDKVIWRTLGALSAEDSEQLSSFYGRLLPLINANSQDETRRWLKQEIMRIVENKMIPLRHYKAVHSAGSSADPADFDILNFFKDPHPAHPLAQGLINPMGIEPNERLYVYESAFVEPTMGPTVHYVLRHPDQLAIDLVHEMVHMTQEGFGYGSARDFPPPQVIEARRLLFELQAYDMTDSMSQVKVMQQYGEPVSNDRPAAIREKIQQVWAQLDLSERRSLANWAYLLPDHWMRRKMYTAPTSDGGIWGKLCTTNPGHGSCGMK